MIWFIVSPMGAGKTLTMTMLGHLHHLAGWEIFSNYEVNYPHTPVRKPDELSNIQNGLFLGDELWSWMDCRASASIKNRELANILLKSRKRGFDIMHTAQFYMQPDKRLREHTDRLVIPSFNEVTQTCSVKIYPYINKGAPDIQHPISQFSYYAPKYFEMYDSFSGIYEEPEQYADIPVKKGAPRFRYKGKAVY